MNNRIGKWFDFLYADNMQCSGDGREDDLSFHYEEAKNESRKNVSVSKFVAAVIRERKKTTTTTKNTEG